MAGEHGGVRDLGFLLMTNFVGENHLIVEFVLQGIMLCFKRFDVVVMGF